jgi:hypothetical protein
VDREVWKALGVSEWHVDGRGWSVESLQEAARERAAQRRGAIDALDAERHARVVGRRVGSVEDPRDSAATARPNLLVAWATLPPPDGGPRVGPRDAVVALRRLFGLPLPGPRTDVGEPRSCQRCGAAAISAAAADAPRGPRGTVDRYGEHALTCAQSRGEVQRRHNEVAIAVRDCVIEAGWRGSTRGGPVFETHGGRPADVFVESHPAHRGGQALDVTIVTTAGRAVGAAAHAEEQKRRKYGAELDRHPNLGFAPLAFDLLGGIGPSAWAEMQSWARAQAARRDATRSYAEALQWVIGSLAAAFVDGTTRQVRMFELAQRGAALAGSARESARR